MREAVDMLVTRSNSSLVLAVGSCAAYAAVASGPPPQLGAETVKCYNTGHGSNLAHALTCYELKSGDLQHL